MVNAITKIQEAGVSITARGGGNGAIANLNSDDILNMSFPLIEKEKFQSIIFTIDAIEKSLMVNKSLQRLYYAQKSYLLKQMFI